MANRRRLMLLLEKVTEELNAHEREIVRTQRMGKRRGARLQNENLRGHSSVPDLEGLADPIATARATGRRNKATARVASLRKT